MVLALTRQKVSSLEHSDSGSVGRGAYVLLEVDEPDVVLVGTGSETALCLQAAEELTSDGISARVVSMPTMELFLARPEDEREALFPPGVPVVASEAGIAQSWHQVIRGNGDFVGMTGFGASAPAPRLYEEFGITAEAIAEASRRVVNK